MLRSSVRLRRFLTFCHTDIQSVFIFGGSVANIVIVIVAGASLIRWQPFPALPSNIYYLYFGWYCCSYCDKGNGHNCLLCNLSSQIKPSECGSIVDAWLLIIISRLFEGASMHVPRINANVSFVFPLALDCRARVDGGAWSASIIVSRGSASTQSESRQPSSELRAKMHANK